MKAILLILILITNVQADNSALHFIDGKVSAAINTSNLTDIQGFYDCITYTKSGYADQNLNELQTNVIYKECARLYVKPPTITGAKIIKFELNTGSL